MRWVGTMNMKGDKPTVQTPLTCPNCGLDRGPQFCQRWFSDLKVRHLDKISLVIIAPWNVRCTRGQRLPVFEIKTVLTFFPPPIVCFFSNDTSDDK